MEPKKNEEVEIDLREIVHVLLSKIWIILLIGIVAAGCTGAYFKFLVTPMYTSITQLCVLSKTTDLSSLASFQIGTQLTQDYIIVAQSRPVVNQVIENLDLDMKYEDLLECMTVDNPADTRILSISVTNPDPYIAKQIVDQFAKVSKARIAQLMDIPEPGIIEDGYVAEEKTSPSISKNAVIAAIIGMLLASGIIIIIYMMDDTIKSEEDVEKYLGLNTLGILPVEETALQEEERERQEKIRGKKQKKGGENL